MDERGFLERPPFEILLVSPTGNITLVALLAGWFSFIALEPLGLTRYTSIATLALFRFADAITI